MIKMSVKDTYRFLELYIVHSEGLKFFVSIPIGLVFNDTSLCSRKRGLESQRSYNTAIQQLEINKYRALGLSTFPYPQQSLGWFTKSN